MHSIQFNSRSTGPVCLDGPILILVCPYGGEGATNNNFVFGRRLRERHIFSANSRTIENLLILVAQIAASAPPGRIDLAIHNSVSIDKPIWATSLLHFELGHLPQNLSSYTTVILAYPDPLGLGWQGLEERVLANDGVNVIILNGRRRIFTLTPRLQRMLHLRRVLAHTRVVEFFLALLTIPIAALLALADIFKTRR